MDLLDAILGAGGAEGDLRRRQTAARKRLRKRDGPGGVLYFDDGNDSDFGNPFLQQFHILHIRFFHNSPCGIAATSFYH